MEKVIIKYKKFYEHKEAFLPEYKTDGSAGMDLKASESCIIYPGDVLAVPTNICVEIPDGYELQVRPRSGLSISNRIGILNSPGTIDSDYRGEIKIILFNFPKAYNIDIERDNFIINKGDRIAQLVLSKVYRADFIEVEELEKTERGDGGFGHTGI